MKKTANLISLGLCLLLLDVAAASAADIKLMTTGAFRPVAQDVIPNFEKQTGNKVTMVSDTAGGLMRRLSAGETFDVLVLTSDGIDALADLGTLNADSIAPLARVGIGLAVSLDATPPQLYSVEAFRDTLLKTRRVAYMDPRSGATSGKAVAAIFQALGIADQMSRKTVLVSSGNAGERVARGEASLALQQASELRLVPTVRFAGLLPEAIQVYTTYTGAIAAATHEQEASIALLAAFTDPGIEPVLKRRGLEMP
jgi:molybdate transport system substrate-binding protein